MVFPATRHRWLNQTPLVAAIVIVGAAGLLFALAWRPALPLDEKPAAAADAAQISRGAQLAAIGNCNTCHTRDEASPYAGARPIATPFGTVYSTNITPDRETGIGGWSIDAFMRAMREGVSRDGHHLYPAFPYDHMTKMRDEDIGAVYAFIETRRAITATPPANRLPFPFNIRAFVAGWKLLFLHHGAFRSDPSQSDDWNRGAYLVEGLGHCGACHTPRNVLGAEKRGEEYAGGESDGWIAPALNAASPAAVPWDAKRLHDFLRNGFDDLHGVAAGPMAPVVDNLSHVGDGDVRSIATYVASKAGASAAQKQAQAGKVVARAKGDSGGAAPSAGPSAGSAIYAGACAQCHGEAGRKPAVRALNLALSSTLRNPRPDNVIRIICAGIHPLAGGAGPLMPGFGDVLSDTQLTELIAFLRPHFAEQPAWAGVDEALRRVRQTEDEKAKDARHSGGA